MLLHATFKRHLTHASEEVLREPGGEVEEAKKREAEGCGIQEVSFLVRHYLSIVSAYHQGESTLTAASSRLLRVFALLRSRLFSITQVLCEKLLVCKARKEQRECVPRWKDSNRLHETPDSKEWQRLKCHDPEKRKGFVSY